MATKLRVVGEINTSEGESHRTYSFSAVYHLKAQNAITMKQKMETL